MSLTSIKLTDAANTPDADKGGMCAGIFVEYSTASQFNNGNTLVLLQEGAPSYFALYHLATRQRLRHLLFVNASAEPRWHKSDANSFYYHRENQLLQYHIAEDIERVVRTFDEYSSISFGDESDLSEDGNSLAMVGDDREIFVYRIGDNHKGAGMEVEERDSVALTPDGNVLVSAGRSIRLYNPGLEYLREIADANGHRHVSRDVDGSDCLVWTNSADRTPIPDAPNAIALIPLADPSRERKLLSLAWTFAVHVTAPMGRLGWCIVGTYNNGLAGELLRVWFDGRPAEHLLNHGSDTTPRLQPDGRMGNYPYQPRASVSRDGHWLVFNSNKGGRVDVYLVDLGGTDPAPLPTTVPSSDGLDTFPEPMKRARRGGFWSRVKGWFT